MGFGEPYHRRKRAMKYTGMTYVTSSRVMALYGGFDEA